MSEEPVHIEMRVTVRASNETDEDAIADLSVPDPEEPLARAAVLRNAIGDEVAQENIDNVGN